MSEEKKFEELGWVWGYSDPPTSSNPNIYPGGRRLIDKRSGNDIAWGEVVIQKLNLPVGLVFASPRVAFMMSIIPELLVVAEMVTEEMGVDHDLGHPGHEDHRCCFIHLAMWIVSQVNLLEGATNQAGIDQRDAFELIRKSEVKTKG